jgi:hypothetical protein
VITTGINTARREANRTRIMLVMASFLCGFTQPRIRLRYCIFAD